MISAPSGNHTLTVYAGQTEESAGSASVTFNVYAPYSTVYPPSDRATMLSVLGLALLFTPLFATIVAVFLIAAVCAVIIVIFVTRKTSEKKTDTQYN